MITYKKPSLDEMKAFLQAALTAAKVRWHAFQNQEHSRNEWLLIFALAFILGMAGKTIAIKTFTIGYEDYLISKTSPQIQSSELSIIPKGPICEE